MYVRARICARLCTCVFVSMHVYKYVHSCMHLRLCLSVNNINIYKECWKLIYVKTHAAISFMVCQVSQWEIKYISLLLFSRQMKIVLHWQFRYIDYIPCQSRALCRIKLLPITHGLVDTWMLTVKPVYKLLIVSDDLKWITNTYVTPFSLTFKA